MRWARWSVAGALAVALFFFCNSGSSVQAGQIPKSGYKVLSPISSGNLTIFPVVATSLHDTKMFLTLDEGVHSGEVVVTEAGNIQGLVRRHTQVPRHDGAEVNTLMLVNNSKRPLLLLAGEIVTGGKQDRVIGKDRIVPPESDPIDLGVFCVEPGRWVGQSNQFGTTAEMVQPSVRAPAMAAKNQQQVWDSAARSRASVSETVTVTAEASELQTTTSYAQVMDNKAVKKELDKIAVPIERDYRNVMRDLKEKNAVGVVVAVNGQILWADIFASPELLDRYWPKLVRSYAAEALTQARGHAKMSETEAQAFVDQTEGRHETAETEPGVYRHAEITGDDYKVFELTSLLPKTDFEVHIAKMADEPKVGRMYRPAPPVR